MDYPNLRAALILIPIAYLCCLSVTLYYFKKTPQLFGELSMDAQSNTIWLSLGYLATNLFIGLVTAASRHTYAWYTFLIMPLLPIGMLIFVAVRRPHNVPFQNIRCSLNFAIFSIGVLVMNLSKVASENFVVLFYLSAAGVCLVLSIANLVYSKIHLIYSLQSKVEIGERK